MSARDRYEGEVLDEIIPEEEAKFPEQFQLSTVLGPPA